MIFEALHKIAAENRTNFFLPLHPRTSKLLQKNLSTGLFKNVMSNPYLKISTPVSFLDMIQLEQNTSLVITDSGGVQKEAYFFQKPGIILRPQTEWVEIVESGTAILADADMDKIVLAFQKLFNNKKLNFPPVFGNGKASEFICEQMIDFSNQ